MFTHDALFGFGGKRTNFDGTDRGRRTPRSPVERGVEGGQLHDDEAGKLFLGVGIGAVLNGALAVLLADSRSRLGQMQRIAADINPRFDASSVVGAPCAHIRMALARHAGREGVLVLVDEESVLHGGVPLCR